MIVVIVAWKRLHLKDSRVRILVSNSVTLNQCLQLSENFFVPLLRKGIIFLLISQRMVVRIQLDSDLESTPEVIESVQIMGFCYCSVFITGETYEIVFFALSSCSSREDRYKNKYNQCFFCSCSSFLFFLPEQFLYKSVKREMFWFQEIHLARASCGITFNTPYVKKWSVL